MATPAPPPGFEMVPSSGGPPPPPPGFELVADPKTRQAASTPQQDPRITALQEPSAAERVLRGVPFLGGALDEIGAGADAALDYVSGGRIGEPYGNSLERRRAAMRKSDEDHPIRNTIEGLGGSVVSAQAMPFFRPFGATGQGAAANAALTAARREGVISGAANAGLNAALAAGPTAFLEGEGGFDNRVQHAKDVLPTAIGIGSLLGGAGQIAANRFAGTAANSVTRDADSIGVQIPSFMDGYRPTQSVAAKMGAIPFVGDDINTAVAQTRNQAAAASRRIANTVAGPAGVRDAGEAARVAMTDWAGDGSRAIQERVYEPVNRAMAGATAPLTATQQAAQELARQQNVAASPIHQRALTEIEQALSTPNGLTFEGITRLRTRIGAMMDNSIDPENRTARAGLAAIYAGLTDDMQTAVATRGGAAAQHAWNRANAVTRQIAERRDTVAKLVGADGDKTGEAIVDKIVSMASTKSSADAARLSQARRVMGAEAWRGVSGNAIQRLGRNQSNEFSADIFLKNYRQLSGEGRHLLFGSTGEQNLLRDLDALANVSQRLQQFSKLGNPSGTGGVAALLGAIGAAASGDMGATFATALGGRGVGILLSRPAVVRNVTAYSQTLERFMRGRETQAALAASAANLARAVSQETGEDPRAIEERIRNFGENGDLRRRAN